MQLASEFPDSEIQLTYVGNQPYITLARGHMRTMYIPDLKVWNGEWKPETVDRIIEIIKRLPQQVDLYYDSTEEDGGSRPV